MYKLTHTTPVVDTASAEVYVHTTAEVLLHKAVTTNSKVHYHKVHEHMCSKVD